MSGNPFNMINPSNPMNANTMGQVKSIFQAFRNSQNPMALFEQLAYRNPNLQPLLNQVKNGVNFNQIFENICKQRGINPQDLMNMLKK